MLNPIEVANDSSFSCDVLWISNTGETGPSDIGSIWKQLNEVLWVDDLVVKGWATDSRLESRGGHSWCRHLLSRLIRSIESIESSYGIEASEKMGEGYNKIMYWT